MLTENYIEALLVDEDLAEQVWNLWNMYAIDEEVVLIAWILVAKGFTNSIGNP